MTRFRKKKKQRIKSILKPLKYLPELLDKTAWDMINLDINHSYYNFKIPKKKKMKNRKNPYYELFRTSTFIDQC